MATQAELWNRIEADAKRENLSPGEYLSRNPARYEAYAKAGRPDTPQANPANDKVLAQAKALAKERGITQDEAMLALFGKDADAKAAYAKYRGEIEAKRNTKAKTGPQPLDGGDMAELQRLARLCDYEISLADIADLGAGVARGLLEDLRTEARDLGLTS